MRTRAIGLVVGALVLWGLAAAPAGAAVICSGPCPDFTPPGSGQIVPPTPILLPPLELELGLVIDPGTDVDLDATGNVALVLSNGVLDADLLDLSANGTIDLLPGQDLFISSPVVSLCAPDCVPSDRSAGTISLRYYLPEEMGSIRIAALGNITLEAGSPPAVPEPTSAVLWLVGAALVTRSLRRRP